MVDFNKLRALRAQRHGTFSRSIEDIEMCKCAKCGFVVKEPQYLGAHEDSMHCLARIESSERTALGLRATMPDRELALKEAGIPYNRGHSVRRGRVLVIEVLWVPVQIEMLCRIADPDELRWALTKWSHDEGFRQILTTVFETGKSLHQAAHILTQVHGMWKKERAVWKTVRHSMTKKEPPTVEQIAGFKQRDRMRTLARMLRVDIEDRSVEDVHANMVANLLELQIHFEALKGAAAAVIDTEDMGTALANLQRVLDEVLT